MIRFVCGALASVCFAATAFAAADAPAALDDMIARHAKEHRVPESLVRRVIMRESRYNPAAFNKRYYGLMQISYPTARSMGYKGAPKGLFDPNVNLTYAVPYLANAYLAADQNESRAVALYAGGYFWAAKRKNLLGSLHSGHDAPDAAEPAAEAPVQTASLRLTTDAAPEGQKPAEQAVAPQKDPEPAAAADKPGEKRKVRAKRHGKPEATEVATAEPGSAEEQKPALQAVASQSESDPAADKPDDKRKVKAAAKAQAKRRGKHETTEVAAVQPASTPAAAQPAPSGLFGFLAAHGGVPKSSTGTADASP